MEKIEDVGRYWVIPGRFLAGPYPDFSADGSRLCSLQVILDGHINHFIDLTEDGEIEEPYQEAIDGFVARSSQLVRYARFPIVDMNIPSIFEMKAVLDHIDDSLAANENIYLHCLGGLGRTGTVVGCYLVRQGLCGDDALRQLEFLRRKSTNSWRFSPETSTQREFVLNWNE